jgi:outer membrane protein assembly factor BamB
MDDETCQSIICTPDCQNRKCGLDPVCGTKDCGNCEDDKVCDQNTGICKEIECTPDCGERICGPVPNGCGNSCGNCEQGMECDESSGTCHEQCIPQSYKACESDGLGDIVWYDSCGNPGPIAEECADNAYSVCIVDAEGTPICSCINHWDPASGCTECLTNWTGDSCDQIIPGSIKWEFPIYQTIIGSPAVGIDGTIYVICSEPKLYAINQDGTLKWEFELPSLSNGYFHPVIAEDGTIYAAGVTLLFAINPDGSEKWVHNTEFGITGPPAIAEDGTIYIGLLNNELVALNPDSSIKWRFETANRYGGATSIGPDGTIYYSANLLYAINPDGTLKWKKQELLDSVYEPVAIGFDGTIYAATGAGYFYAINPDGSIKWQIETMVSFFGASPVIAENNTLYIISSEDYLIAISEDGDMSWFSELYSYGSSTPAIADNGTIYLTSFDVYAVDPNGDLLWMFEPPEACNFSPAIAPDGTIYAGCTGGVYAFNDDNGGLANSAWPKFMQNNQNTGRIAN